MSLTKPVKMVLVSRSRFLMEGLRSVLKDEGGIEIIGEMSSLGEIGEAITKTVVDLIFMDNRAMDMSNRELSDFVTERSPNTKIILFEDEEGYTEEELSSPNIIHIGKETDSSRLREIVASVCEDQPLPDRTAGRANSPEEKLSKSEARVLGLVSQGLSNKEIARRLSIKEKTVKAHLTNIFGKLRLRSRYQLIALKHELANRRTSRKFSPPF